MAIIERVKNKITALQKQFSVPSNGIGLKTISETASDEKSYFYLISVAGHPNLGDEWIAYVWIKKIIDAASSNIVIIDVPSPKNFSKLFKSYIDTGRLIVVSNVWSIVNAELYREKNLASCIPLVVDEVKSVKDNVVLRELVSVYKKIESIHMLGGGYINDIWEKNALVPIVAGAIKHHYKCTLSWTGSCVAPFSDDKLALITQYIQEFDFISVRDKETYDVLAKANPKRLKYGYDDVYLGFADNTLTSPELVENRKPQLIINIQGDISSKEKLAQQINDVTNFAKRHQGEYELVYWDGIPAYDSLAYTQLQKNLGAFRKLSMYDILEATIGNEKIVIPKNSFAISSRFHIHFYLSYNNINGYYLLAHDKYYDIKHNSLCDRGSNWKKMTTESDIYDEAQNFNKEDVRNSKFEDYEVIYGKSIMIK